MSAIEGLSATALRPQMDDAMDSGDDDHAHTELDAMTDSDIARALSRATRPAPARAQRRRDGGG